MNPIKKTAQRGKASDARLSFGGGEPVITNGRGTRPFDAAMARVAATSGRTVTATPPDDLGQRVTSAKMHRSYPSGVDAIVNYKGGE